jgi:hypothetical protein
MRIDSSGNVGIGVVPENWYTGNNVLAIGSAAYMYGSTNTSLAAFGVNSYYDLTDNRWEYTNSDYASRYYQIDGQHIWETAPSGTADAALTWSEAMRIDSSGNLLVGTTDNSPYNNSSGSGFAVSPTGYFSVTREGVVGYFNRNTSDGEIVHFRKDGSTVGSIGSRAGVVSSLVLDPRGSGAGLTADTRKILPATETGATNDGLVDLGRSTGRFKDLYLSGSAYVGDKIIHDGDTDTYVQLANNAINLSAGGTAEVQINVNGMFLEAALKEDYDALSGTSVTCNLSNGGAFSLSMSGNTTFTFSGAWSGWSNGFILELTGNGSTVTWPSSVDWAGGTAPDAPASGETDIYVFWTRDGGTTWYGVQSIDAAA